MFFTPPTQPNILIVDANESELKALKIGFELEGFSVFAVSTVVEMNRVLQSRKVAITLIDLMMPEKNGLQIARDIRDEHPAVSTVLMSAYHLSPLQLARANTGAVGFVPKPFRFEDLVQFIRNKITAGPKTASAPPAPATPRSGSTLFLPFDVPETA
ncbi:MAG: response regulator [Myxococcales bacterium]|jgi:DNA-binding NtrC family response regulator|nr:response regulator [Myxococcales bacterium]